MQDMLNDAEDECTTWIKFHYLSKVYYVRIVHEPYLENQTNNYILKYHQNAQYEIHINSKDNTLTCSGKKTYHPQCTGMPRLKPAADGEIIFTCTSWVRSIFTETCQSSEVKYNEGQNRNKIY